MDLTLVSLAIFAASTLGILAIRSARQRKDRVEAQFVVTGTILLIFYSVCFLSGICTILNFVFRWIF